jgi:hypothetical protein
MKKTKIIYGTIAGGRAGYDYNSSIVEMSLDSFESFKKDYEELAEEGDVEYPNSCEDYPEKELKEIYDTLLQNKPIAMLDSFGEGTVGFGFNKNTVKLAVMSNMLEE